MRTAILAMAAVMAVGCGAGSVRSTTASYDSDSADVTAAKFKEVSDDLSTRHPGAENNWIDLRTTLFNDFYNVCGDTFCDGDYNPVQPLSLTCSVDAKTGAFHMCLWTFAGSYDTVAKTSGNITAHPKIWKCSIPLTGDANTLINTLNGSSDALQNPLPGSSSSIYDAIGSCLSGT